MTLYSSPPPLHTFTQDKPTLLVCWWITLFCTTIILVRVAGRFVRTETLFREDKIAALALIPLYLRMGCVHFILVYGTNNAILPSNLSVEEVRRRTTGSILVIVSRASFALTLWVLKYAILEFCKRLTSHSWTRCHETILLGIKLILGATLIGIIVADFAECLPFYKRYQLLPDPGGQCRQGYVQLLTMASCNIVTDLLLVLFPVTLVLRSHMSVKRKIQLVLLFSLSLAVVTITIYRVPYILREHGNQQIRSLFASVELLFATTAANGLVLGTFVRDRGAKKAKFNYASWMPNSYESTSRSRKPAVALRHWGSDEDLVRDLGLGVQPELREVGRADLSYGDQRRSCKPAPVVVLPEGMRDWQFPDRVERVQSHNTYSDAPLLGRASMDSAVQMQRPKSNQLIDFCDVGGLLEEETECDEGGSARLRVRTRHDSAMSGIDPLSTSPRPSLPFPTFPASLTGFRRGSQALIADLGGILTGARGSRENSTVTELQHISPSPPRQDSGVGPRDPRPEPESPRSERGPRA